MGPNGAETKNDCGGEDQQRITVCSAHVTQRIAFFITEL
jgi:hypothetical protein